MTSSAFWASSLRPPMNHAPAIFPERGRSPKRRLAALRAFALATAAGGCSPAAGAPQEAAAAASGRRSVVVITLDTTRRDYMGFLGHAPSVTPTLDALAAESAVFEDAYTVAPLTLPAHTSMMTGLYPMSHHVRDNSIAAVSPATTTLAEVLHDAGYATGAAVAAFVLDASFGLDQGFERYHGAPRDPSRSPTKIFMAERPANGVVDQALADLARMKAPYLYWLHFFDAHFPYDAPGTTKLPTTSRADELVERRRQYGEQIRFVDGEIARLFQELKRRPEWNDLVIVVAADHGESLYDGVEPSHGWFVHDSTVRIPLFLRFPGASPRRVAAQVSLIDVMPTLLSLLGLERGDLRFDGVDLAPLVRGETAELPDRVIAFESWYAYANFGWSPFDGCVRGPLKYVRGRRERLFDRAADPTERTNAFAPSDPRSKGMRQRLDALLASPAASFRPTAIELDDAARANLLALGYLEASTVDLGTHPDSATLEDAEDHVDLVLQLEEINTIFVDGQTEETIRFYRRFAELAPRSVFAREQLASSLLLLRRPELLDEAEKNLRAALAIDYHRPKAHYQLGLLEMRRAGASKSRDEQTRHRRAALAEFRCALEVDANSPEALANLATLLSSEEKSLAPDARAERAQALQEASAALDRFLSLISADHVDRAKMEGFRADVKARLQALGSN